jgi:pimeloyl-ACP methyl ester carboxylesterase
MAFDWPTTVPVRAPPCCCCTAGRAGSGTVARSLAELSTPAPEWIGVPTTVLWPEFDPLFPQEWGDRLSAFFADITVKPLAGVGHFVPLEAPGQLADAIRAALASPAG